MVRNGGFMSNFSWLVDGSIVGLYLVATMAAGLMVRKYVGKVEHFLIAGREMDVYLGIASLAATEFGVVTCMYTAQNGYEFGFAGSTPGILNALAMLIVGITGFCVKPLRDSGVMTLKANAWFATPQLALATYLLEQGQWNSVLSATPFQWLLFGFVGLFGFYVAYMTWFTLLKNVSVDQAVPFILLMTPIGLAGAVVFLGETITPVQLTGGAVLMVGLAIVNGVGVPRRFMQA